jgi:pimeloyl-ACP methyl ester carboxylesterase
MTTYHNIAVEDGTNVFYREAGSPSAPVLVLLHGFPSSSVQYRNLIPLLATKYHVIAPDLPGFGFTTVPKNFTYTFDALSNTIAAFLTALNISKLSVYIFDYGGPVALRIALKNKFDMTAIITQNGNAYEAGFGQDFWAPIFQYWKTGSEADREVLRNNVLTLDTTKYQYVAGVPSSRLNRIAPETWTFDYEHMVQTPGNFDAQLDLFYDYRTNVELYPKFQNWFRETQVPVLAVWGAGDPAFRPPGAQAFKQDLKDAEVVLLEDAGHFALETNLDEIANYVLDFLGRKI